MAGIRSSKKVFKMNDDYPAEGPGAVASAETGTPESAGLDAQMDQVVRGLSGAKAEKQIYAVDIRQLEPFPDQPFRPYTHERIQELADDIKRVGILNPILARKHKNKLQILSGHNRWRAAGLAGLTEVPVIVVEADDDQAALVLTSSNLRQREKLMPSEKAFAYKMQMEVLKRQGRRAPGGKEAYEAASLITRQTGDSRMQIHRLIRLTELDPGFLDLLDRGKIGMTPAVSVSYLSGSSQREVLRCVLEHGARLSIDKAEKLKKLAENIPGGEAGNIDVQKIMLDIPARRNKPGVIKINYDKLARYLPENIEENDIEDWIIWAIKAGAKN